MILEKKISFIHAADLHLDSPFKGLSDVEETLFQEIRQSTFTALNNLVAAAIKRKVDFILLVGDLFDNEKQSLKAQISLRNAFQELQRHQIEVYLSYGNHDFIDGNIYPITYPDNVHIFSDEQVQSYLYTKENTSLAKIYGFSYERRAVTERKIEEYEKEDTDTPFHIAMLHGSIESNTEHDTYAPFKLGELVEKDMDYWALGHIHGREVLKEKPMIVYPGNIQGRNRKEIGAKGCYYVELSEGKQTIEFISLHAIEFQRATIDLSECETIHQVERAIINQLRELNNFVPQLLDVTLISNHHNIIEWKNEHLLEEMIEIINESFTQQKNWIYVFRCTVKNTSPSSEISLKGEHFLGELTTKLEHFSPIDYLDELFQHKDARKYLEMLTKEDEEMVKKEAYELVIHELMKE
ncbi:metallophosphoesterase family protein [Ornithinibacillus californiensis]|uniref:metallophosphoesterase family protein n=1 Tax=Ornithinibacillus californiensis TaxID=161536 RepID=UPI00064DD7C6|nr:DNA repair exonuclease [Ornithinibacillus californiensis]